MRRDAPDTREDRKALVDRLARRYGGELARVILRCCSGNVVAQDVKDLTQQTFLNVLKSKAELPQDEDELRAYLFEAGRNAVRNERRKIKGIRRVARIHDQEVRYAAGAEGAGGPTRNSLWSEVELKLAHLADGHRDVLAALSEADVNKRNVDVGAQLGISAAAADGRIRRTIKAARQTLGIDDTPKGKQDTR